MMNPTYQLKRMSEIVHDFEPSEERKLAAIKLTEAGFWLSRYTPTKEALERDQSN